MTDEKKPDTIPASAMTLRDYFAGCALTGLAHLSERYNAKELAADAYLHADAMLAERAKGGTK